MQPNLTTSLYKNSPKLSRHAEKRASQRGMSKRIIELLQIYGDEVHDHNGCLVRYFSKKMQNYILSELPKSEHSLLKNKFNSYMIEADGFIITTGYLQKRIVRH